MGILLADALHHVGQVRLSVLVHLLDPRQRLHCWHRLRLWLGFVLSLAVLAAARALSRKVSEGFVRSRSLLAHILLTGQGTVHTTTLGTVRLLLLKLPHLSFSSIRVLRRSVFTSFGRTHIVMALVLGRAFSLLI